MASNGTVLTPTAHSGSATTTEAFAATRTINLLAYVHLRNIHASTGAGRVARQLTEHLSLRKDIRLRVLADKADHARILPLVGQPWTQYHYHLFDSDTSRQQARWFALGNPCAEAYWPEAQVVFCTAESYVPTRKAGLVVTAHDAAYFENGAHRRDTAFWKQRCKWQLLYGKLARKADLFHTVSHFSADRLAHFFPSIRSRIRVVHNAVSPHFFRPVSEAGLAYLEANRLGEKPFILVPGGLHYRKNAELVFEVLPILRQHFPDLTVAVVNHSDPFYAAQAETFAPALRLLGFVDDDALQALYAAASAVWFPSRYEGFGLPVVEAMACGTAVVASNASSIPEIAGDAALLVSPQDAGAHADALREVLTRSPYRDELGRRGLERASQFTWTSSADQLKKCFDELL